MKKHTLILGGILSVLVLIGAGCNEEEKKPESKPAEAAKEETKDTTLKTGQLEYTDGFTLAADPAGKGRVHFSWGFPGAQEPKDGFRLLRGLLDNPSYPENFWYHRTSTDTEAYWINLPKGQTHFRVCAFENKQCVAYSNDVVVMVE